MQEILDAPLPSKVPADLTGVARAGRFLMRVGVLYLSLYSLYLIYMWFGIAFDQAYSDTKWARPLCIVVPWVGRHLLGTTFPIDLVDADSIFTCVKWLCIFLVALAGAASWSIFDCTGRWDKSAVAFARICVRYSLAHLMFVYGLGKVMHLQMAPPTPSLLIKPYGDSTPFELMWTMFGYSGAYSAFGGGMELLGGILVLFVKTTTLGAFVIFAVIGNVFLMDCAFGVPLKLEAGAMVIMSIFLLWPDMPRLLNVLVLNRPAPACTIRPGEINFVQTISNWISRRGWTSSKTYLKCVQLAAGLFKVAIIGCLLLSACFYLVPWLEINTRHSELTGLYEVDSILRNGRAVPSLMADSAAWRRIAVDPHGGPRRRADPRSLAVSVAVETANGGFCHFVMRPDYEKHRMELKSIDQDCTRQSDPEQNVIILGYRFVSPMELLLDGQIDSDEVSIKLRKQDLNRFALVNSRFHLIQIR